MEKKIRKILSLFTILTLLITSTLSVSALTAPAYSGNPYAVISGNEPAFSSADKNNTEAFESYSPLDTLGRCGVAYANICKETMPTSPRVDISNVLPSGWHSSMGWQRCHLIGFQLAGENANNRNLITGTEYMNVSGMLPFENMVADYVKETNGHVLYRVTPDFKNNNLVVSGVQIEAWSVEDDGDGICFNVYCYNVQPGKIINYATGVISSEEKECELVDGVFSKTLSANAVKKSSKSFKIAAETDPQYSLTYSKKSGNKKITVSKAGKVTVKKDLKKGTYKIKVAIKAKAISKTFNKTVTVKIAKTSSGGSGKVYWTPSGKVYHKSRNCATLKRSKTVYSGTVSQSGKSRACKVCS